MENSKPAPITLGRQQGECISVVGDTYRVLITGKQTGGAFAAMEMFIPPNGGPSPHAHAFMWESLFITEGEFEVKSQDGTYIANEGSYVVIPKGGVVHDFKNHTGKLAKLLCFVVPSGLEEFFLEVGTPVAYGTFLLPDTSPEFMAKMKAAGERYGQVAFPPNYLDNK